MKNDGNNFINDLAKTLPPESVIKAKEKATKEIFLIRLAELRKIKGLKQDEISAFSQSGISKLESRKDMKISTLIDYLGALGMGMEIKVYPKTDHIESEELILVRV